MPATALASVVRFETPLGSFDVEMYEEDAPLTVENFLNYVKDGDFANSFVHRRSRGFVIQGGGYTWVDGVVGDVPEDPPVQNEFKLSNVRGTIAMAKLGGDPNSATSEWFINLGDNSDNLDSQNGGFTVFGKVLGDGMEVVDAIAELEIWNFGGAFNNLPLIDYKDDGPVQAENFVFTDITLLGAASTEIDIASVVDISGDAVPDVAYLTSKNQPKVSYYSGANGNKLRTVKYLGAAWTGIAAATVADSNANGVANDPSIAVLASKTDGSKHVVEVRRAKNGALIKKISTRPRSGKALPGADPGTGPATQRRQFRRRLELPQRHLDTAGAGRRQSGGAAATAGRAGQQGAKRGQRRPGEEAEQWLPATEHHFPGRRLGGA
jgi:cyclophilin family peptidyl-prolyl cis-trans isomerase